MSFLDGVAAQISLRDRAFFMHVVLHDMKRSQEAIIRTRDKQLLVQPSTKHSFVVCFKHTVSPPKLAITTVQSYNQWCEKLIKPESPAPGPPVENIAPIQVKDTVVYPVLVVPHGAKDHTMTLHPLTETASEMFGWKVPLPTNISTDQSGPGKKAIESSPLPEG